MKLRQFEYSSKAQKARVNAWRNKVAGNGAELTNEAKRHFGIVNKVAKEYGYRPKYKSIEEAKKSLIRRNLDFDANDLLKLKQNNHQILGAPQSTRLYKNTLRLKNVRKVLKNALTWAK